MLVAKNISYRYGYTEVLSNIDLHFQPGKLYAIIGKSGSGKSTLLSILAGISQVQNGTIVFNGELLREKDLTDYRRKISIVFQSYNLINYLSPVQNVAIALSLALEDQGRQPEDYLALVGLSKEDMYRKCQQLSGGQQQRVAIARAIASGSKIVFADEPTGNLDSQTATEIIRLLKALAEDEGKCVVCVTHDQQLEDYADEVIGIQDGKLRKS